MVNKIFDMGRNLTLVQLSTFILIPKKPGAMECYKYRTISIMSQQVK